MTSVRELTKEQDVTCEVCGKNYKYKGALLRHKAREHFDIAAEESILVRATCEIDQFQDVLVGNTSLKDLNITEIVNCNVDETRQDNTEEEEPIVVSQDSSTEEAGENPEEISDKNTEEIIENQIEDGNNEEIFNNEFIVDTHEDADDFNRY